MIACIGEPISWPRLERHAGGAHDAQIAAHVAACPACRQCLDEIERDVVALPALVVPAAKPRRWIWLVAPVLAAAAVLALVLRPERPEYITDVKGVGQVIVGVVRERAGAISFDARTYRTGDRWKVIITCPLRASAWIDVSVADGATVDHPLAPAQITCGNQIAVPGAFAITGARQNRVCATIAAAPGAPSSVACVVLAPE